MTNPNVPFVTSHAIERYQQIIGPVSRDSALKSIHWAWFNGLKIKTEQNGTIHTMAKFRYYAHGEFTETDAVIVTSPSDPTEERTKRWAVKTMLTMDHYKVNGSLTISGNRKRP